ncbi:hypothetical protein AAC387_Pa03g0459 [Persea americana]
MVPGASSPQGCSYLSLQSDIDPTAIHFGSTESTSIMAGLPTSQIKSRRRPFALLGAIIRSINRGSPVCVVLPHGTEMRKCSRGNQHQRLNGVGDNFRIIISSSQLNTASDVLPRPTYWDVHQLLLARLVQWLSNVPRPLYPSFILTHDPIAQNISSPLITQEPSISSEVATLQNRYDALRQQDIWLTLLMNRLDGGSSEGPLPSRMLTEGNEESRLIFEDILILSQASLHHLTNLHDRHNDLRLDVDNMSYEELLALEDRIGNVNTGLGEEVVNKNLKHSKCVLSTEKGVPKDSCSICQEEYLEEDEAGTLDCGHYFHVACIKQWLGCKNICPICKSTALSSSEYIKFPVRIVHFQ